MTGVLEQEAHAQRIAAARVHNTRRAAMVTDLWLYGIADERPVLDIQRDVASLGPEHCAHPGCSLREPHPIH